MNGGHHRKARAIGSGLIDGPALVPFPLGHLGTRALKKKTPQKRGASPRFGVCQDSSGIGGIGKPSSPPCIRRYGDRGHTDVMAVTKKCDFGWRRGIQWNRLNPAAARRSATGST